VASERLRIHLLECYVGVLGRQGETRAGFDGCESRTSKLYSQKGDLYIST